MIARFFGTAAVTVGLLGATTAVAQDQDLPTVRLGLLQYGTVNWEAQTIIDEGLDETHGFELEIVPFAGGDATKVALMAGNVDVTTDDWLMVSRQRAMGDPLVFIPYSTAIGAVMAPCDGDIQSLQDLEGKTIGVAGGPLDKSWLMLQGMASEGGMDLASATTPVYGAPPLLAEKLRQGELDAVLNYWHYNARLETEGYCQVISAQEAARSFGAEGDVSAVGYVMNEEWADENPDLARGFVDASRDAKDVLAESDEAWERLREMTGAENDEVFEALKQRFREGIPTSTPTQERDDTAIVYQKLAEIGGEQLVGPATEMAPGTFWSGLESGS